MNAGVSYFVQEMQGAFKAAAGGGGIFFLKKCRKYENVAEKAMLSGPAW